MAVPAFDPARPRLRPVALWRALPFTAQLLVLGMLVGLGWFLAKRASDEAQLAAVRERNARLAQWQRAEVTAARVGTALQQMSRAHRGFLLTGDEEQLADFARARLAFLVGVGRLLGTETNAEVRAQLDSVRTRAARWEDSAFTANVALRRARGLGAFAPGGPGEAGVARGARLMDAAAVAHDQLLRELRAGAADVEALADEAASRDELLSFLTSAGALAVLMLLLTLLMRLVARELGQVVRAADALEAGHYAAARLPDAHKAPNREMAVLAVTFDRLAASIERRERQLQDDIVQLKELERLKRDFVSTVSHELRTPLTSMRGALGLMLGGKVGEIPGRGQELLRIAMTNTERLIRLINDILDIEKMDAGQMSVRRDALRLRPLVEGALAGLEGFAREHGVRVALTGAADADAAFVGDADRIIQVLTNLVSNAAKFSPKGSSVDVSLHPSGQTVTVRVRDHGPASRRSSRRGSSGASSRRAAPSRARAAAPGSASTSRAPSWSCTAGGSASNPRRGAARCSGSRCRRP